MLKMKSAIRLITVFAICFVSLGLFAGESLAAAPEWSGGFPKLVQNDVLLQWKPVKGATEYKVYKSGEKDKGLKLLATVKVNRFIDKGIVVGKTSYYYVVPVIGGKEGERSAAGFVTTAKEKVFIPLKTPKLAGAHIKDLPGGKYAVGIRWEEAAGSDLVGVNVYRSKVKGKDYVMVGSSGSDIYEDTDVQQGVTYYYVVTSVDNQFKETKYSNEISITVPAAVAARAAEAKGQPKKEAVPTEMVPAKLLFRMTEYRDASGTQPTVGVEDVVVDEAVGHIYVSSVTYGGILVYDMEGRFQFGIRADGVSGKEKILGAAGLGLGANGEVYLADVTSNIVRVFRFDGKPVGEIVVNKEDIKRPRFARQQPSAYDVAVDSDGTVYIADMNNASIHAYTGKGKHLFDITVDLPKKEKENFGGLNFITVDKAGELVLIDTGSSRLMVYDKEGGLVRTISSRGTEAGQLDAPIGLTVDKDGNIYVASHLSPNIQAFSNKGEFRFALSNEKGDGPLDIASVYGIAVDSTDRLYIVENGLKRVSVYQMDKKGMKAVQAK